MMPRNILKCIFSSPKKRGRDNFWHDLTFNVASGTPKPLGGPANALSLSKISLAFVALLLSVIIFLVFRADRMMQEVYSNDYREDEPFTFKRPKRSQVYPSGKENLDSDRIFHERNLPGNKNTKINSLLPAQQGIKEPGSLDVLGKIDNYSDRFRLRRNSKQRGTNLA